MVSKQANITQGELAILVTALSIFIVFAVCTTVSYTVESANRRSDSNIDKRFKEYNLLYDFNSVTGR